MNTEFTIEKNVPMPKIYNGRTCKYPFAQMEVGDSFFVPSDTTSANSIGSSVNYYCKTHRRQKFAVRREPGGSRVWRVR